MALLTTIRVGRTGGRDSTARAWRPNVPNVQADVAAPAAGGAGDRARLRAHRTGAPHPRPYMPMNLTAYTRSQANERKPVNSDQDQFRTGGNARDENRSDADPETTGEFTIDYTPPAWYTQGAQDTPAPAPDPRPDGAARRRGAPPPPPGGMRPSTCRGCPQSGGFQPTWSPLAAAPGPGPGAGSGAQPCPLRRRLPAPAPAAPARRGQSSRGRGPGLRRRRHRERRHDALLPLRAEAGVRAARSGRGGDARRVRAGA